jgi:hypothetical protein
VAFKSNKTGAGMFVHLEEKHLLPPATASAWSRDTPQFKKLPKKLGQQPVGTPAPKKKRRLIP